MAGSSASRSAGDGPRAPATPRTACSSTAGSPSSAGSCAGPTTGDQPLRPWRVEDPAGRLTLELTPRYDKHTLADALVLRTETHQVFGSWSGSFTTDDGEVLTLEGLQGFAEESRSRW